MANLLLFKSSIICTLIHLGAFSYYTEAPCIYYCILINGMILSIWNHGSTNIIAQKLDRCSMVITFFINLSYMLQTNTINNASPLMIVAVLFYLYSKWCNCIYYSNLLHASAHICITLTHIIILNGFGSTY
jgi:hypothetical protein